MLANYQTTTWRNAHFELLLLYSQFEQATVIAVEPRILWAMERTVFRNLVLTNAYERSETLEQLITAVPIYIFFSASTHRWTVFRKHIHSLSVKPLSETR